MCSALHLIHKLRRSISHRPRHLFDLPDEILCLILEYCCQDLDFLLWSCPLVTLENQFCHDCFHCTLCHGPALRVSSLNQRRQARAFAETPKYTHSHSTEPGSENGFNRDAEGCAQGDGTRATSSRAQHRKRRKRNLDTLVFSSNHNRHLSNTTGYYAGSSPSSTQQGAKPCPWNGDRPWCLHLQRQQLQHRVPLLWRLVPQQLRPAGYGSSPSLPARFSSSHPHGHLSLLSTSLASMQPPAKVAFNTFLQRIEAFFSSGRSQQNRPRYTQADGSIRTEAASPETSTRLPILSHTNPTITPSWALQHAVAPVALTSGFSLDSDRPLHRRRTSSTTIRPAQSTTPSATMNRSLSTTGTINTPSLRRYGEWIDAADEMYESEMTENGQHRDDFDNTIHLSSPFQLLLVSRRFADAAVHSLHRNLVFHGHDPYQVESVLCTLFKDDGLLDQDQSRLTSLGNVDELNEELLMNEEDEEEAVRDNNGKDRLARAQATFRSHGVDVKSGPAGNARATNNGSNSDKSLWQLGGEQGAPMSWIESLNHSLKRFSRLQGGTTEVDEASKNTETEPYKVSVPSGNSWSVGEGGGEGGRKRCAFGTSRRGGGNCQDEPLTMNLSESRWTYRRYARRVVLNFAHPQASPLLLVRALECIGSRCHGQIQALDLHANEKMQDSGLGSPEELTRLFGSGFSKLKYLRLQGGFVDNQLLYALLSNLTPPTPNQSSDATHGGIGDRWKSFAEPRLRSSTLASSVEPCCLSQVFLGPGSVTDSAVERLIDVAGKTLEVFTVTSCVDVGGGALASLLTKCPKLRVLAVHRSLARDRDLLEGLGIPLESTTPGPQQHQQVHSLHLSQAPQQQESTNSNDGEGAPPQIVRKTIVAPLERLEFGTVKLTCVAITEILKATCKTLRFVVLETQHFSDELLRNVVSPLCRRLEGLHFDDPEQVQRLQQQMQGLGFSAGRRGPHLPRNQIVFGRTGRSFYSDPGRYHRSQAQSHNNYSPSFRTQHHLGQESVFGSTTAERQRGDRDTRLKKVSAWLGETTTDEWVTFGDCALWSSAASPAVSYDNGGANGPPGSRFPFQHRQYGQPLHQIYHKPALAMGNTFIHGFNHHHRHQSTSTGFLGDSDELLDRYRVARETVDEVQEALSKLESFTVMELDFILERKGLYEAQLLMRQDDIWVQSAGFRALQIFYLCLFLSTIYFSVFR